MLTSASLVGQRGVVLRVWEVVTPVAFLLPLLPGFWLVVRRFSLFRLSFLPLFLFVTIRCSFLFPLLLRPCIVRFLHLCFLPVGSPFSFLLFQGPLLGRILARRINGMKDGNFFQFATFWFTFDGQIWFFRILRDSRCRCEKKGFIIRLARFLLLYSRSCTHCRSGHRQ